LQVHRKKADLRSAHVRANLPPDGEMKKLMAQGNDIYITRSCLKFTPTLGQILGTNVIKLDREITLRPRKSLHVDCDDCTQH